MRLLFLLLLIPTTAAGAWTVDSDTTLRPAPDFRSLDMENIATLDVESAKHLRAALDSSGDGIVDAAEVEFFMSQASETNNLTGVVVASGLTLDARPASLSTIELDVVGAEGNVTGEAPLTFVGHVVYTFEPAPTDTHVMTIGGSALAPGGWEGLDVSGQFTVMAPKGFVFAAASTAPGLAFSADRRSVGGSVADLTASSPELLVLQFEPDSDETVPAPAAAWIAVLFVVLGARRRWV